ncbi:MAG: hypothetical protein ACR2JC_06450 [Chloroflexota bacterium]
MPTPLAITTPTTQQRVLHQLREDVMDTDPTAFRWTDATLLRCIDMALDRYSQAAPRFQTSQLPTYPQGRIYPSPDGSWYVDKVEYPIGYWPKRFSTFVERASPFLVPPTDALIISAGGSGPLTGAYLYAFTFLTSATTTPVGETTPGPTAAVTYGSGSAGSLTFDLGPYGTVARNLYRTAAGGSQLRFLAQIADNLTSAYSDSVPDASLGANAPTANTTQGIPTLELQLEPGKLPQSSPSGSPAGVTDGSVWVEITAAYKHELDPLGTTVPEQHVDVIVLRAKAYALFAYLTTTNDNFDYVDGQFRDRVDDTKASDAWRAHASLTMERFEARLDFIKHESNAMVAPQIQWGDKPVRWDRL